jgi:hypothetical protein
MTVLDPFALREIPNGLEKSADQRYTNMTHPEINLRGEFLFTALFWTLMNAEKR